MEAIRIFKEMRGATNGQYPKIVMWENVPGAFTSNRGEDFRIVLEEICKIKDSDAFIPRPQKWSDAGLIMGNGYSVAWRVLDAQFWGVPQRRRRIFLVADFGGQCAGEILFESEGLQRSFAESSQAWNGSSAPTENGVDKAIYDARGKDGQICPTITGDHENRITDYTALAVGVDMYNQTLTGDVSMTLTAKNSDCHHVPCVIRDAQIASIDRSAFNQGKNAKYDICIDESGIAPTVVTSGASAVGIFWNEEEICSTLTANNAAGGQRMPDKDNFNCVIQKDTVRRLTPRECGRLQGMPDWWCDDVPHKDAPEYKMWGNGMALPCVLYVFENVRTVLLRREVENLMMGKSEKTHEKRRIKKSVIFRMPGKI